MKYSLSLNAPCESEVNLYLEKWKKLDKYVVQENALNYLYTIVSNKNTSLDEVLIKVNALNTFYSTRIFNVVPIAQRIVQLDIDKYLETNDLSLVDKIDGELGRSIYSFATKYCSWHKPNVYPIYDKYVCLVLDYFKNTDHFANFSRKDLRNYQEYYRVYFEFIHFYKLDGCELKSIDKYLWQLGKENFRRIKNEK